MPFVIRRENKLEKSGRHVTCGKSTPPLSTIVSTVENCLEKIIWYWPLLMNVHLSFEWQGQLVSHSQVWIKQCTANFVGIMGVHCHRNIFLFGGTDQRSWIIWMKRGKLNFYMCARNSRMPGPNTGIESIEFGCMFGCMLCALVSLMMRFVMWQSRQLLTASPWLVVLV